MSVITHYQKIDLRKAQLRMLEILTYIDSICRSNGITYWIDYGTLLGAVRHKGFIPWDDDIDVTMPLNDFNKFKKVFNRQKQESFILQDNSSDENYFNHWAVVRDLKSEYIQTNRIHNIRKYKGLQVDIFIVDTNIFPLCKKITDVLTKINYVQLLKFASPISIKIARVIYKFQCNLLHPLFYMVSKNKYFKRDIYRYVYGIPFKEHYDYNLVYPLEELEFENHCFYVPHKSKEYLSRIYGDYMILPPLEKRCGHEAEYIIW